MRTTILLILILISSFLTAQKDTTGATNSFDLYFGYRPSFQNFYNQLNTTNKFALNAPLQIIGIGTSGEFVVTRDGNFYGHFIYNQVIPKDIIVNDTIKCKITGFNFSFAYGDAISTRSGLFSLYYYAGFNTGRLRIYDNDLTRQKNVYFSPKIGIQPKIKYKDISLSFILECDYDITNPNWKHTLLSNREQTRITKFRQSGITAQIGIGYCIGY
jgi:hypothetical protein